MVSGVLGVFVFVFVMVAFCAVVLGLLVCFCVFISVLALFAVGCVGNCDWLVLV